MENIIFVYLQLNSSLEIEIVYKCQIDYHTGFGDVLQILFISAISSILFTAVFQQFIFLNKKANDLNIKWN